MRDLTQLKRVEARTHHPAMSLLGVVFHGVMLFVVPFVVGGVASMFLEVSQVAETADTLGLVSLAIITPIFLVQFAGVVIKTTREARFLRERGALSARTFLDSAYRNTRILTPRGTFVLVSGLVFVVLALAFKWASLGVVAVASLVLFYLVTGASVFLSAFMAKGFARGLGRSASGIRRHYEPTIARAGDRVEERFVFNRVPIMPGFFLAVQDRLPARLATEIRHVVPPSAGGGEVSISTDVRNTPRGVYEAGPARIWYYDMLGLTKVNVASLATAELKVLPSMPSVEVIDPPKTPLEEPDILTVPHKFPTEDFFRFREYASGDDTRRLHWKLSMRVGQLQVRLPEARERSARKSVLALDTWVPPRWLPHTAVIDDLMDALVGVWVSTANQLMAQGEHVSMVAALPDEHGDIRREVIDCSKNNRPAWLDAGARARWQTDRDVFGLFEDHPDDDEESYMVVLTTRLTVVPTDPIPGRRTTWIYLHPGDTIGPPPPDLFGLWLDHQDRGDLSGWAQLLRFVRLPYPAGSEDNALRARVADFLRRKKRRDRRVFVRRHVIAAGEQAFQSLLARPDVVYRMQTLPDRYRLVGISSGGAAPHRDLPAREPLGPGSHAYPGQRHVAPPPPVPGRRYPPSRGS